MSSADHIKQLLYIMSALLDRRCSYYIWLPSILLNSYWFRPSHLSSAHLKSVTRGGGDLSVQVAVVLLWRTNHRIPLFLKCLCTCFAHSDSYACVDLLNFIRVEWCPSMHYSASAKWLWVWLHSYKKGCSGNVATAVNLNTTIQECGAQLVC